MSKSTELDRVVKLYILNSIDNGGFESCDYYTACESIPQKIDFLRGCFESYIRSHVKQIGLQAACKNWLMG